MSNVGLNTHLHNTINIQSIRGITILVQLKDPPTCSMYKNYKKNIENIQIHS